MAQGVGLADLQDFGAAAGVRCGVAARRL